MTTPQIQQETPRLDTIDLSAVSRFWVLSCSTQNYSSLEHHPVGESLPGWLRYVIFSSGGNGVSAFFAISGFLITFISIRRFGSLGSVKATVFYRIRFAATILKFVLPE
jgi:peptidoglycan/LPS O-acetylase OafA/YrhL